MEPEKLAEFNKIIIKDYKINEVVDSFNPKFFRKKEAPSKPAKARIKEAQRKVKEETEFEMEILNDMMDKVAKEGKRVNSPNKERRLRALQAEKSQ